MTTLLRGKSAIIAPPEVVAKYGLPPGGGKISPRQGVPYPTVDPPRAGTVDPRAGAVRLPRRLPIGAGCPGPVGGARPTAWAGSVARAGHSAGTGAAGRADRRGQTGAGGRARAAQARLRRLRGADPDHHRPHRGGRPTRRLGGEPASGHASPRASGDRRGARGARRRGRRPRASPRPATSSRWRRSSRPRPAPRCRCAIASSPSSAAAWPRPPWNGSSRSAWPRSSARIWPRSRPRSVASSNSPVPLIQEMGELHRGRRRQAPAPDPPAAGGAPGRVPRAPRGAAGLRGGAAAHRDPHPRRRRRRGAAAARSAVGQRAVGRGRLGAGGRSPLLEVVRDARARQRSRRDGDARPRHRLDDRGRGVPAAAQAQRADLGGRLHADHHPEDRVVHVGVLPDRRAARRAATRADRGA